MKKTPRKAFVLAAGFGTRMLPLTRTVPKPLLPLLGKPLIVRTLEMLRAWGVREVCINTHHLPDAITDYLAGHPVRGLAVGYSHEEQILGTGGALPHARWFLEGDEPFWMLNADVAMRVEPDPLLRAFARSGELAACWLHGERGPRTVEMQRGQIAEFRSARAGSEGTYTFCGLQLLSPRILEFLPCEGFATIVEGYEAAMKAGHRIAGVEVPGSFWADLGTPSQYIAAHAALARRKNFVSVGRGVKTARGARIERAILWDGAWIGPRAVVRDAIVGQGCRVDFPVTGMALRAIDALAPPELALLHRAGFSDEAAAIPLGARGSARAFTRVWKGAGRAAESAILVHYDAARVENPLYASHARFLAAVGFPVPRILADDRRHCATLLEDLGDASIQNSYQGATVRKLEQVYRDVLDAVAVLHGPASRAARKRRLRMVPSFRPRLYQWEREYFAEHMLGKRMHLPAERIGAIKAELRVIGRQLLHAPLVVVHRDLQSSNVILRDGKPLFIDFQGMRWGPAAYDIASLLGDPYMELEEGLQVRLLEYYARLSDHPDTVRELFWPASIQRLAQALGAYARLGAVRDTARFAIYIPPAIRMMHRALGHVRGLPHLRAWCDEMRRTV